MRSRRSSDAAWSEAAARRLAQLTADLGGPAPEAPQEDWWDDHTRVVRPAPPADPPAAEPAALPRPGRHAARRRALGWRPPTPALPVLGSSHVAVVALLAAAGLALTAWWVTRDSAEPVAAVPVAEASPLVPQPSSTAAAAPSAGDATTGSPEAAGEVTVDVTGRVRRPGIVVLDVGARVVDALEAAGGARPGVDLASLNLARVLVDGEQLVVGQPAPAAPAVPSATSTSAGPTTLVNLNTASETELESLPEVGPVTAQAIIGWRDEHGGFTSVDELLEIDGIGEATLAQISPYVTV
jgi:competence protein ComEA